MSHQGEPQTTANSSHAASRQSQGTARDCNIPRVLMSDSCKILEDAGSDGSVGMGEPSAMTSSAPEPGVMGKGMRTWGGWRRMVVSM